MRVWRPWRLKRDSGLDRVWKSVSISLRNLANLEYGRCHDCFIAVIAEGRLSWTFRLSLEPTRRIRRLSSRPTTTSSSPTSPGSAASRFPTLGSSPPRSTCWPLTWRRIGISTPSRRSPAPCNTCGRTPPSAWPRPTRRDAKLPWPSPARCATTSTTCAIKPGACWLGGCSCTRRPRAWPTPTRSSARSRRSWAGTGVGRLWSSSTAISTCRNKSPRRVSSPWAMRSTSSPRSASAST